MLTETHVSIRENYSLFSLLSKEKKEEYYRKRIDEINASNRRKPIATYYKSVVFFELELKISQEKRNSIDTDIMFEIDQNGFYVSNNIVYTETAQLPEIAIKKAISFIQKGINNEIAIHEKSLSELLLISQNIERILQNANRNRI